MNLNDHLVLIPLPEGKVQHYFDWDDHVGYGGNQQITFDKEDGDSCTCLIVRKDQEEQFKEHIQNFLKWLNK